MAQIWARCCRTIPGFDFRDVGPPLMKILKEEIKFEKSGLYKTGVPARWEQSRGAEAGTSRSSRARLAARLPLCCCGFTLKAAGFVVLSWCPFTVTPHSSASSLCLPRRWCQSRVAKLQCRSLLRVWKFPQEIQKIPKDVEANYFQTPGAPAQEDMSGCKESVCTPDRSRTTESACGSSLADRLSHPVLL